MTIPIIQTHRLTLRPPEAGDLKGWAEFSGNEEAMRFMGGPVGRSTAWQRMAQTAGSWSLQGFGLFSVLLRKDGSWIGRIGPHWPEGWPAREISWGLLPQFQGHGYAREAVQASISFVKGQLGCESFGHFINPGDYASIRLAEAIGSRNMGPSRLPAPFEDDTVDLWLQRVGGRSSTNV